MERTGGNSGAVPGLIFAASFASLACELALMRIFSISLWYHFAFMVISIAMPGIGASGTVLSVFPGLKSLRSIPRYALALAVLIASVLIGSGLGCLPGTRIRLLRSPLVLPILAGLVFLCSLLLPGIIGAAGGCWS